MFRKSTCWIVLLYGLLLLVVGVEAYLRKQSLVSLLMGTGIGLLMIVSALLLFYKKKIGIYSAVFLTLLLVITFGIRYTASHHMIPATLCVLSGGMLLFLTAQSVKWKQP